MTNIRDSNDDLLCRSCAVSYTHLDVYKRQELDWTNDIGAGPFKSPYRWAPLTWKVDSVAVSYTHLDVYKRQAYARPVLYGNNFEPKYFI